MIAIPLPTSIMISDSEHAMTAVNDLAKLVDVTIDACEKSAATGWLLLKTTSGEIAVSIDQKTASHLLEELLTFMGSPPDK